MRLGSLGPVELLLIVTAIVLIFGASKIGDIGGALGKSIKEFKKASRDEEAEAAAQRREQDAVAATQPPVTAQTAAPEQSKPPVAVGDYRPPDAQTS